MPDTRDSVQAVESEMPPPAAAPPHKQRGDDRGQGLFVLPRLCSPLASLFDKSRRPSEIEAMGTQP
jgi:hypothetical protein